MNPLPSTSRVPNLRDYNINKILSKKTYIPNLSISRNVVPKVKVEPNAEIKNETSLSSSTLIEKRRPRSEKKLLAGSETFAPPVETCRARITIKSKPKVTSISSSSGGGGGGSNTVSVKKELIERDNLIVDAPPKVSIDKFAQISSASPKDLPISVPRLRVSMADDTNPFSLLKDIFDPSSDESPLFILKTPKYLPALLSADNEKDSPKSAFQNAEKEKTYPCTMSELPSGQIGKLQIMKSGRLRLVLGECKFWLHRGVRVNFKEELAFVNADAESKIGEIIKLGNIKDRIMVVPESVTIFANE